MIHREALRCSYKRAGVIDSAWGLSALVEDIHPPARYANHDSVFITCIAVDLVRVHLIVNIYSLKEARASEDQPYSPHEVIGVCSSGLSVLCGALSTL